MALRKNEPECDLGYDGLPRTNRLNERVKALELRLSSQPLSSHTLALEYSKDESKHPTGQKADLPSQPTRADLPSKPSFSMTLPLVSSINSSEQPAREKDDFSSPANIRFVKGMKSQANRQLRVQAKTI